MDDGGYEEFWAAVSPEALAAWLAVAGDGSGDDVAVIRQSTD